MFLEQDTTVAMVWSFSNNTNDIPYRISCTGKTKGEGGNGRKWECNCPSFTNRGGKTCKHLITMRQESKSGAILADKRFQLTEYGLKILKLDH